MRRTCGCGKMYVAGDGLWRQGDTRRWEWRYCAWCGDPLTTPCPHCKGTGVEPADPREGPSDTGITMCMCRECGGTGNARVGFWITTDRGAGGWFHVATWAGSAPIFIGGKWIGNGGSELLHQESLRKMKVNGVKNPEPGTGWEMRLVWSLAQAPMVQAAHVRNMVLQ